MTVKEVPGFEGLLILEPKVYSDTRGYFLETFNEQEARKIGLPVFVQDNQSCSSLNVLRGMHFQKPPFTQAKLVRVVKGKVWDVVIDCRKNSKSYGKWFGIELSEQNQLQFFVPEGFAHGFLSQQDQTIFSYKCSDFYHPQSESGIIYNDRSLAIQWPVNNPIVSSKDLVLGSFNDFISPF